jgi:hypothetical protein
VCTAPIDPKARLNLADCAAYALALTLALDWPQLQCQRRDDWEVVFVNTKPEKPKGAVRLPWRFTPLSGQRTPVSEAAIKHNMAE